MARSKPSRLGHQGGPERQDGRPVDLDGVVRLPHVQRISIPIPTNPNAARSQNMTRKDAREGGLDPARIGMSIRDDFLLEITDPSDVADHTSCSVLTDFKDDVPDVASRRQGAQLSLASYEHEPGLGTRRGGREQCSRHGGPERPHRLVLDPDLATPLSHGGPLIAPVKPRNNHSRLNLFCDSPMTRTDASGPHRSGARPIRIREVQNMRCGHVCRLRRQGLVQQVRQPHAARFSRSRMIGVLIAM